MQLHFSALTKSYQGKAVFQQLSGIIGEGDKIGLIGANGIGKTTLLKLLAGEEEADSGVVRYLPSAAKVLYLEQYPTYPAKTTVFEVLLSAAVEYRKKRIVNCWYKRLYGRLADTGKVAAAGSAVKRR